MCANPNGAVGGTDYDCERAAADCDEDDLGGVRPCVPGQTTYWTLFDQDSGAVLSGGEGSGCCATDTDGDPSELDETITAITVDAGLTATLQLTTASLSGVHWYINDNADPTPQNGWDSCGFQSMYDKSYVVHVHTGTARAWDVHWNIDDWGMYTFPARSPLYFGARSVSRGMDRYLEGSLAEVTILEDPISPGDADCMFTYGETRVGICVPQEDMRGREWFGTFLGDSRDDIGSRDLNGARTGLYDSMDTCDQVDMATASTGTCEATEGTQAPLLGFNRTCVVGDDGGGVASCQEGNFTLAQAMDGCATFCREGGYTYMGLQWTSECFCDNDFGGKGEADASDCDVNGDGQPDCAQNVGNVCGYRNAVYNIESSIAAYEGCFIDGTGVNGARMHDDARVSSDFGIHLDGHNDYVTIDPVSQKGVDRRDTNYASDGSFTISFWFWKRECTLPGSIESLFSHQANLGSIYNDPAPDARWLTYPTVIASEAERLDWMAFAGIEGTSCTECETVRGSIVYPMYLSLDMDHGHNEVDVHATLTSFMAWKYPDVQWKGWKRGRRDGPDIGRALFVAGDRLRAENGNNGRTNFGYSTVMLTNDVNENPGINVFLACSEEGVHSTLRGDVVRTVIVDDNSNRATFDWSIDSARSGGLLSDGWVHVAMTMEAEMIGVYVDGIALGPESIGFLPTTGTEQWVELQTDVTSEADRLAWIAADPDVTNTGCLECDNLGSVGAGLHDDSTYWTQYPMFLGLDDRRGRSRVDSMVASYVAYRFPNVVYTKWKRGNKIGAMSGRALFKSPGYHFNNATGRWSEVGLEFRSENEDPISAYSSIFVTTDVAWTMTAENLAYPNPWELNGKMAGLTMMTDVFMGVNSDVNCNTYYLGHIAQVALFRYALDSKQVACLHRDVEQGEAIGVCQAPEQMRSRVFTHDFLGNTRTELRGVELGGDAYLDPELGIQLDGDGDYLTTAFWRPYGDAGTFTISMWITRSECAAADSDPFESLYSHMQYPDRPHYMGATGVPEMQNAAVQMMIACARPGLTRLARDGSVDGNHTEVLRVQMQDNAGMYVEFDIGLTNNWFVSRAGDYSATAWMHVALSVEGTNINLAIDGERQWQRWNSGVPLDTGVTSLNALFDPSTQQLREGTRDAVGRPGGWTFSGLPTAFSPFSFGSQQAYFGAMAPGTGSFFEGGIAGVVVLQRAISREETRCLFSWGETALRVPPMSVTAPVVELMGEVVDGCIAIGQYVENPICEAARRGLSACASLGSNAEYCADTDCVAAIAAIESDWELCQDDPALAPLWADLAGICTETNCTTAAELTWSAPILDGATPEAFTLIGDAHMDGALGLSLDGDADYAMVDMGGMDYGADGEFSVAMWFSRSSECRDDADWEFLWSHQAGGDSILNSSNVHIACLCEARHESLGDGSTVITTIIMDDNRNFTQFDWSV